jgi:tRNA(His) guanylyltransferase
MTDRTSLGDRMKTYEAVDTQRKAFKGQPIIARLDGKGFHSFCKGLKRPYDERLSRLMVETMKFVLDRSGATVGYTQSDEITLAWFVDSSSQSEYIYDGRFQKMDSLLASMASVFFTMQLPIDLPEKNGLMAMFDCRTHVVPNLVEAANNLTWRQQDCTKNAISMAAQSMFSHKSLQGLNGSQMQEKMWAEKGVNFNDYPAFFRRGTFARRMKVFKPIDDDVKQRMAAKGVMMPTAAIERSEVQTCNAWLTRLEDPVSFLFKGGPETYRAAPGMADSELSESTSKSLIMKALEPPAFEW